MPPHGVSWADARDPLYRSVVHVRARLADNTCVRPITPRGRRGTTDALMNECSIVERILSAWPDARWPEPVERVAAVLRRPDTDAEEIASALAQCPEASARIVAMSRLPWLSDPCTARAAATPGLVMPARTACAVVLGTEATRRAAELVEGDKTIYRAYFWRRSLATAVFAARLAPVVRDMSPTADAMTTIEACIAGLLADVGVVLCARVLGRDYAVPMAAYTRGDDEAFLAHDREVIGEPHAAVGAAILSQWGFPSCIAEAVRSSHDQDEASEGRRGVTPGALLREAGRLGRLVCARFDAARMRTAYEAVTAALGVDTGVLAAILPDLDTNLRELAALVGTDMPHSRIYTRLCEHLAQRLTSDGVETRTVAAVAEDDAAALAGAHRELEAPGLPLANERAEFDRLRAQQARDIAAAAAAVRKQKADVEAREAEIRAREAALAEARAEVAAQQREHERILATRRAAVDADAASLAAERSAFAARRDEIEQDLALRQMESAAARESLAHRWARYRARREQMRQAIRRRRLAIRVEAEAVIENAAALRRERERIETAHAERIADIERRETALQAAQAALQTERERAARELALREQALAAKAAELERARVAHKSELDRARAAHEAERADAERALAIRREELEALADDLEQMRTRIIERRERIEAELAARQQALVRKEAALERMRRTFRRRRTQIRQLLNERRSEVETQAAALEEVAGRLAEYRQQVSEALATLAGASADRPAPEPARLLR